jgi:hypothetical protein
MTHLDIWNTSYGQKKGWELEWQFDSRPLKVGNRPDFLACKWRATCHWKDLDEGYNFCSDLILIGGLHTKLWGPKVAGVLTLAISGLPFGSLGQKAIRMWASWRGAEFTIRGEGSGFPQIWVVVSLVSRSCPWLVLAPKVFLLCINHFVLVLCRFVWVVEACQLFLVPSCSLSMHLWSSKVLRTREHALSS